MPIMTPGGRLEALFSPAPGRSAFTVQLALISALITVVVVTYQLPSLAVTVYAAFFLYRPERSATIVTSIVMTIFITIVLLIALALTIAVVDHPFWRVLSMAAVSFVALFVGSASKLKPFAPTLALIIGYVLDLIGGLPFSELATRGLLYSWLIVGIPAGICIIVALLVGPAPRRLLEEALAMRLRCAAGLLRGQLNISVAVALLKQGDAGMVRLLKSARQEHSLSGSADAALTRAIISTLAILTYSTLLAEGVPEQRDDLLPMAETLDEMASILAKGSYPIGIDLSPAHGVAELLRDEIVGFAERSLEPIKATAGGFLQPDAFTNPAHVRYGLKTTAAAMSCYALFQLLDWPGIHTCLITCYVVSLGSAGETIEKLTLRICGCLLGAALGFATLIFIMPQAEGVVELVAIVAIGTLPAAWVAAGSPRIAYAGLQIAFAFYLIVLQGPSPAFDLSIGRDRIVGVLLGNFVMYLMFTKVWPVSISADVDPSIARILHALSELTIAGREGARVRVGSVRNSVAGLRQELSVARYEPRSIRPPEAWFSTRALTLERMDALQAPLLEQAAIGGPPVDAIGREMDAFARSIEHAPDAQPDRVSPDGISALNDFLLGLGRRGRGNAII